jgi:Recombinase
MAFWRGKKRVEGRYPYGDHPSRDYDAERAVVERVRKMKAEGASSYVIARLLNDEGVRTRYGKEFTTTTIQIFRTQFHVHAPLLPQLWTRIGCAESLSS